MKDKTENKVSSSEKPTIEVIELPIPMELFTSNAHQLLSVFVQEQKGGAVILANMSILQTDDDPAVWGIVLADIYRWLVEWFPKGKDDTKVLIAQRILSVFLSEASKPTTSFTETEPIILDDKGNN